MNNQTLLTLSNIVWGAALLTSPFWVYMGCMGTFMMNWGGTLTKFQKIMTSIILFEPFLLGYTLYKNYISKKFDITISLLPLVPIGAYIYLFYKFEKLSRDGYGKTK